MKSTLFLTAILILITQHLISQTFNHPTIGELKLILKATAASTTVVNGKPDLKIAPEAIIKTNAINQISKINYSISDKNNTSIIYQCSYNLNNAPVYDSLGLKVFFIEGNDIHIRCTKNLSRDNYLYQITTEDSQSAVSPIYSEIK